MSIESVRVSYKAREELIRLKTRTRIENWNSLCRWALCHSLSINIGQSLPFVEHVTDSNVEMAWKTFSGKHDELYWAIVRERCKKDGLDPTDEREVAEQFKRHLHRGIQYLASYKDFSISGLFQFVADASEGTHA
tara:strand:+ start:1391 stop:1795 length:405 start_codon:yes stop_codon:yes gene_type:complete